VRVIRTYYYRRLINNKTWTPWDKVELDIHEVQGDDRDYSPRDTTPISQNGIDLLPVVWNRRLYLFWLILTKKKTVEVLDEVDPRDKINFNEPEPNWEIRLAWSNYDNGKWKPKQVSEETLHVIPKDYELILDIPSVFRLRTLVDKVDGSIELHVFMQGYSFGKYRFESHNDNAKQFKFDRLSFFKEIEPGQSGHQGSLVDDYFMGYISNKQLILKIPYPDEDNFVNKMILYRIPDTVYNSPTPTLLPTFTLLPLNQFLSLKQSYSAPYFYQDHEGIYFVRSREDSEVIVKQVEDPDLVYPPINEKPIDEHYLYTAPNIHDELYPASPDPIMNKTITNPWISAEQKLASQRFKKIVDQLGGML
jgi:hypothetical protein